MVHEFFNHPTYPYDYHPFQAKEEFKPFLLSFMSQYTSIFNSANLTYEDLTKLESDLLVEFTDLGPFKNYIDDHTFHKISFNFKSFIVVYNEKQNLAEELINMNDISTDERYKWLYRFKRYSIKSNELEYGFRTFANGFRLLYSKTEGFTLIKNRKSFSKEELLERNWFNEDIAQFLNIISNSNLSIIVSGGRGSGKTTTLDILSSFINSNEPIVTVEESEEIQLPSEAIYLHRLTLDEMRERKKLHTFLNHSKMSKFKTMASILSSTPEACVGRMHSFESGISKEDIANSIDMIVQVNRIVPTGERKITHISYPYYNKITDDIIVEDIFVWDKVKGFCYTGFDYKKLLPCFDVNSTYFWSLINLFKKLKENFEDRFLFDNQLNESFSHFIQRNELQIRDYFLLLMNLDIHPISRIAERIHFDVGLGKSLHDSLSESRKIINSSDWDLFVHTVILSDSLGKTKEGLHSLYSVLSSRNDMREYRTKKEIYEYESSDEWSVLEIVDLLDTTSHLFENFPEMVKGILPYVSSKYAHRLNDFTNRIECGQPIREALNYIVQEYDTPLWKSFVSYLKQTIVFDTDIKKTISLFGNRHRKLMKNLHSIQND